MEKIAPTIITIFGVTGDLSQNKLFPALYELYTNSAMPEKFHIVGFSRREMSDKAFREFITEALKKKNKVKEETSLHKFLSHITYEQGVFDDIASYEKLKSALSKIDDTFKVCTNKLLYLAVPPTLYEGILTHLKNSGLSIPCGGELGWTRILIEKPFGTDLESARKLDHHLSELFKEEQIFRIDHYLAKETLQNILTFRFSNALFEDVWNKDHVESVHIRLFEPEGIEGRGGFYDTIGALRDVGQNHILQMLALVTMENPKVFEAGKVRAERAKIFSQIKPILPEKIAESITIGQYEGYLAEESIKENSRTETYFKLHLEIESERWKGIPFILESGHALAEDRADIVITLKPTGTCLCPLQAGEHAHKNVITFRGAPNEGISVEFFTKKPGLDLYVEPKELSYSYRKSKEEVNIPDAYEKVLYDAIRGDQVLFTSTEEVDLTWKYITPILENMSKIPLHVYKKGSAGPDILEK